MKLAHVFAAILFSPMALPLAAAPGGSRVAGKVTLNGTPAKPKPLDLSKEPACQRMHASNPLFPENIVTGSGNSLRNVVVYISAGAPPAKPAPLPPVLFDQQDCHYTTHVLAFRVGQEVKISNGDPFSHNIHPIAKINREWNKIQPAGTPPFSYAYNSEEFIPVKCNIHPWMQGYFAIFKTSYFAVTGEDGQFTLPELPPGQYTITAWHETFGTQSRDISVAPGGAEVSVNFAFTAKP